jgi:ABC-type bacteriocin/lantibiotic exporter with double-glycine peptidase domain
VIGYDFLCLYYGTITLMWNDSGTWIALGISVLFLLVGVVMHRVIKKVLQTPIETKVNDTKH